MPRPTIDEPDEPRTVGDRRLRVRQQPRKRQVHERAASLLHELLQRSQHTEVLVGEPLVWWDGLRFRAAVDMACS